MQRINLKKINKVSLPGKIIFLILLPTFVFCILQHSFDSYAQESRKPITVNGDTVEYSPDAKEVTAEGNVVIIYEESKLTCDKITVNTVTKTGYAEGNVRLEDAEGVIEAEEVEYDFDSKTGRIIKPRVFFPPYYGKGREAERVSEDQLNVKEGYMTTCNLDEPHYRIFSKKTEFYPQNKIKTKQAVIYAGKIPLFYLPQYTHSLKDPFMHVRFIPGKKKDWGAYMLSAWRYNLTQNMRGRIYLDYRSRLGFAEGFGLNYTAPGMGKGDLKYYYTQERARRLPQTSPAEFQRYLVRWRHIWNVDSRTKAVMEYYKIYDAKRELLGSEYNFLKDYFYREYEKDSMPKTYLSLTRTFDHAGLNILVQKRVNPWYTHSDKVPDEKLPEITFDLPNYKLGNSPLYFKNHLQFSNLSNKNATPSDLDDDVIRIDAYNQFSLPTKVAFLALTPYVGVRETYYTKDKNGDSPDPRTTFYSGIDLSTKFYRLFEVTTNFLGLNINGLRHIVTPIIKYAFNNEPTLPKNKLQVFDDIDTIERKSTLTLELINRLQTKRNGKTVDLARFKARTDYNFVRGAETGKGLSDFIFDIELMPYAWLSVESDITYDFDRDNFRTVNVDLITNFGKERSFGIGHRYERNGGKELTSQFIWRFNPKWKFSIYERYQFAGVRKKGLKEQEYVVTRDLHCWELDLAYNISKEQGHTVWMIFRLKAFPEIDFEFDQSYNKPKPGSQSQ